MRRSRKKDTRMTSAPTIPLDSLTDSHWSAEETANVAVIVGFVQALMNDHDFDRVSETYADIDYIQHNRGIPNGITGVISYLKPLVGRFPEYSYDVKRIIASGDLVVLHSHVTLKAAHRGNEAKGFIITDTFRVADGKPAEHWDAVQPIDLFARMVVLMTGGKVANENPTF